MRIEMVGVNWRLMSEEACFGHNIMLQAKESSALIWFVGLVVFLSGCDSWVLMFSGKNWPKSPPKFYVR
jgi:hypothetical protein